MRLEQAPRVKICGITSVPDALFTVAAGADAIGLVFYPKSPRYVQIEEAKAIAKAAGPFVTVVGLFVNHTQEEVNSILNQVPIHLLQFHGGESNEFCCQFNRPFMKAIRMAPDLNVEQAIAAYSGATGILLDSYQPGVPGGTGKRFEWHRFPQECDKPLVLAGGLSADNVAQAVITTRPYGVDVSGGVEQAPGKKCPGKVTAFVDAVSLSAKV